MDVRLLYWALGVLAAGVILGVVGRLVDPRLTRVGWILSGIGVALLVIFVVLAIIGMPGPGEGNV